MAKDPAFLFYSADFMMGAMTLSMEQRGQYITLLSIMHQKGRLTKDEVEFVIGGPPCVALTKKFKVDEDGNWYNERLEAEITKRSEFTKSRRKSLEIDNGDMVHIYLIKDPEAKTIKIGSSKYPELRLKEVKKYKPDAEFLWISPTLFERINEKILHEEFIHKKFKYDWFHLSKEDIENIRTKFGDTPRTTVRTVNEIVNEDEDAIEVIGKGVEGERYSDEWFARIFDDIHIGKVKSTFPTHDVDNELKIFKLKVRASAKDYIAHDTGGIRKAFIYQLSKSTSTSHAKRNGSEKPARRADATITEGKEFGTWDN